MLTTVEGTYRDGKIELREAPPASGPARVLVTFLPDAAQPQVAPGTMLYGMFAGDGVNPTEEDFKAAEWRPTEEQLNGD